MNSFRDEHNRTWTPRVTTLTIQRFEELSDVDLFDEVFEFIKSHTDMIGTDGTLKLGTDELFSVAVDFARAITHGRIATLNAAIYASVEKQATALKIDYAAFCDLLVGEVAGAAIRAAGESYWRFFQSAATGLGDLGVVTVRSVPGAGATSTG